MAEIIDGKKISEEIKKEIVEETKHLKESKGVSPGLAVVLVGNNPASESYVRSKGKVAQEMGFYSFTDRLPVETTEQELLKRITQYNLDSKIHGILVQLPLPKHINEQKVIEAIDMFWQW